MRTFVSLGGGIFVGVRLFLCRCRIAREPEHADHLDGSKFSLLTNVRGLLASASKRIAFTFPLLVRG
jgi:hypothetical protein